MADTPHSSALPPSTSLSVQGNSFNLGPPHGTFILTITNITNSVSLKLDRSNYLLWRSQFLPVLHSQGVMGFINGDIQPPAQFIPIADSTTPNPHYVAWFRVDQTLQSWILATLTPGAVGQMLGLKRAQAMWLTLEQTYASNLQARILHLRMELQNLKKGTMPIFEFLEKAKTLADSLSAAGRPIDQDDLVSYILHGLGSEYEPFL
ncbi:hypothetical protein H6P81_018262 [Aristolochia fimbriata]|uniref:Retrotransposon Copia-like N-terminal domain-containing protein n=1 Tax=Aristolochia fimbriata TaxID=158543 RepID=A0AAV7E1B6_ARIFI|nr:hypothetical protein H6P81_018262 [Aristolochia fimbriata]